MYYSNCNAAVWQGADFNAAAFAKKDENLMMKIAAINVVARCPAHGALIAMKQLVPKFSLSMHFAPQTSKTEWSG